MPKTGTIGEMINFYYIFSFSAPYEPFVPVAGANQELFFTGQGSNELNQGLIDFRYEMTRIPDQFMAFAKLPSFPVDETQVYPVAIVH